MNEGRMLRLDLFVCHPGRYWLSGYFVNLHSIRSPSEVIYLVGGVVTGLPSENKTQWRPSTPLRRSPMPTSCGSGAVSPVSIIFSSRSKSKADLPFRPVERTGVSSNSTHEALQAEYQASSSIEAPSARRAAVNEWASSGSLPEPNEPCRSSA